MKFNIHINQKSIIALGIQIDLIDAALLDCLRNMFASSQINEITVNGRSYKWIAASKILTEMPLLGIKKPAIQKRIRKLEKLGFIERCSENQNLSMSFFRSGVNLDKIYNSQGTNTGSTLVTEITSPLRPESQAPYDQNHNYNNTINNNTINNKEKEEEKTSSTHTNNLDINSSFEKGNQEVQSLEAEKKRKEKISAKKEKIELPFEGTDFEAAWNEWKEYKKIEHSFSFKSVVSEKKALTGLKNIAGSEAEAVKIIDQSIENGWKGFFALKDRAKGAAKGKIVTLDSDYKAPEQDSNFWESCGL